MEHRKNRPKPTLDFSARPGQRRKTSGTKAHLLNSNNLARVFRMGRLPKALDEAGLLSAKLRKALPKSWVAHCEHPKGFVGFGIMASCTTGQNTGSIWLS